MKVLTSQQMRELDQFTVQTETVTSLELMERAAQIIVEKLVQRWDHRHRFVIFAGPGNNGGDGLAVARLLVEDGYTVSAYLFNIKSALSQDCESNRTRLVALALERPSLTYTEVSREFDFPELKDGDIIIDGLFGIGLSRPLDGGFASLVRAINTSRYPVVSIDMPSGLMSEDNTYNDKRSIVCATLTLTIHRPKPSLLMPENESFVGELETLPIGLSTEGEQQITTPYNISEAGDIRKMLHQRPRFAHKGMMGHALLMAGSKGMCGAAIMAARACLRGGVGKVTVQTHGAVVLPLQVSVPEAIVQIAGGTIDQQTLSPYQAIGIGPGMGLTDMSSILLRLFRSLQCPLVMDADALTMIGQHHEWLERIPSGTILTPHIGELERIIGKQNDGWVRLSKARDLARNYRFNILVKGRYSAVIDTDGNIWFNPTGNPGMATAGSGDVLFGLITALLAQGYASSDALRLAVWIHGRAGDLAVQKVGSEEALIATDIIEHFGEAFKSVKSEEL